MPFLLGPWIDLDDFARVENLGSRSTGILWSRTERIKAWPQRGYTASVAAGFRDFSVPCSHMVRPFVLLISSYVLALFAGIDAMACFT